MAVAMLTCPCLSSSLPVEHKVNTRLCHSALLLTFASASLRARFTSFNVPDTPQNLGLTVYSDIYVRYKLTLITLLGNLDNI